MDSLKFIHAADFHLDSPFRGGNSGYGHTRREDVRRAFSSMISLAIEEEVDLLLLCGDLFEQEMVTRDTLSFVRRELSRIEQVKVLILPGNHDPLTKDSWYKAVEWPQNVTVIPVEADRAAVVLMPEIDLCVSAFGFTQARQESPDFGSVPEPAKDSFNLLLIHGSLDAPNTGLPYNPITMDQVRKTAYDYVALGHYHSWFEQAGNPWVANSGSPEPLGFDELGDHGVILATIICNKTSVKEIGTRFVPLATRAYVSVSVDITNEVGNEALQFALAGALQDFTPERHLPCIRLIGTPLEPPNIRSIVEWLEGGWLLCRVMDDTRPPRWQAKEFSPESLTAVFLVKIAALIESAENDGDTAGVAKLLKARQMGLEALAYKEVHLQPERQGF